MAQAQFDFYNPFMTAAIVTPDGKRFPLWTKTNQTDRNAVNLSDDTSSLPFLQEISVELQLAYLPIIKATLTPPYKDGINFLDSRLIEWGQSTIEVTFGYIGMNDVVVLSDTYTGVLLKPEVQLGSDITITLNGQGVGGFSAVRQEGNVTLNNVTPYQIVKHLADAHKIEIDDKAVENLAPLEEGLLLTWKKLAVKTFIQGGDSYWTAILKVVKSAGLHMYLVGNTLNIVPPSYIFSSAPQRLFRLYDFANGRLGPVAGPLGLNQVFPILSASSPTSAIYLPGSSQGFFVQDVNSFNREEIKKFIGEDEVAPARTEAGAANAANAKTYPEANKQTGDKAEMYPGNPADEQLVSQVKAEYSAQTTLMGVQLTLESLGDPTLLPGTVIAVRGLGKRLSGNYSVLKVTHTLGGNAYTMSMECVSNVAKALEDAKQALGPVAPEPTIDENGSGAPGVEMQPKAV